MTVKFALAYDQVTGEIESVFDYVEDTELAANTPADHKYLTSATGFPEAVDRDYWVRPGTPPQLVAKYEFSLAPDKTTIDVGGVPPDGVLTVTNVPVGTLVKIYVNNVYESEFVQDASQEYEYTTSIEGTHRFDHTLWPYKKASLTVTAVLP